MWYIDIDIGIEREDRMIGRYKDKEIRRRDSMVQIDRVQIDRGEQRGETVQYIQIGRDDIIQRNGKRESIDSQEDIRKIDRIIERDNMMGVGD